MITLTKNAIREFSRQLTGANGADDTVRIGLRAGGCAGTKYSVEIAPVQGDDDHVFAQGGLRVLCDPISLTSLDGLRVDFVDALAGGGFQYENPNAALNCDCGKSFGTQKIPGGA